MWDIQQPFSLGEAVWAVVAHRVGRVRKRKGGGEVIVQKARRGSLLRCLRTGLGCHVNAVGNVECGFGSAVLGRDHQNGWKVKGIVP